MATQGWATRRLQKDLQEVMDNPLFNVVGEPLMDNLFEWHVNIRTAEGDDNTVANAFVEAIFHLVLRFPPTFPKEGPTVYLCTPLPHPNVALQGPSQARHGFQNMWKVSLWDCMPAYKGWSSAYSVQSVLLQLQTFLLQDDLLYDIRKVQIQTAVQRAKNFVCDKCGHTGKKPFPVFLTPFEIEVKFRNRQRKHISRPRGLLGETTQPPNAESCVVQQSADNIIVATGRRGSAEEVDGGWKTVGRKKQVKASRVTEHPQIDEPKVFRQQANPEEAMGLFGLLPLEPLSTIMCLLSMKDMSSVSMTCRGLRAASEDGYIWKKFLHRYYPTTTLSATSMEDWKHVFMLEQSNIIESLRCFHLKCTHEEEVLGFPISFTTNPRTRDVQHIEAHLDILSQGAYDGGVRCTADNQSFQLLLPLYINQEHFERALPSIQKTMVQLCPTKRDRRNSTGFHPEMVLDVMPKVLNTLVVLVSDKGIQASERAIEGYCMLHRLFLALCERFNLWKNAQEEVMKFKSFPQARTKERCPNLGHLLALLSVCTSTGTAWKDIVRPLTDETFDRNVLWNCKHDSSAKEKYIKAGSSKGVDEELLRTVWEGSQVSLRLNMFHAGFLHLVARPHGVPLRSIITGYDKLYGMPSAYLKKRLQEYLLQVMKVFSPGYDFNLGWPYFFKTMGMECPTKEHFTGWLGQCWKNSLRKKYHTASTQFEKIHRSGVSKILLKGESYSAPPNMKKVQMLESWGYVNQHIQFLDASCLLYNFKGEFIGLVDYARVWWAGGALRHSGDVIDYDQRRGTHTIEIFLANLPKNVKELYFTMSGFVGARLNEFRLPYVQLKDCKTETELCTYTLEGKSSGTHTSVIMCRMFRKGESDTRWEMEALGQYSAGDASNYDPIKRSIEGLISARKSSSAM